MLIEGEIELQFQGKTIHPLLGEEILIPAHQPHTVINTGRTINRWYYGYKRNSRHFPQSFLPSPSLGWSGGLALSCVASVPAST